MEEILSSIRRILKEDEAAAPAAAADDDVLVLDSTMIATRPDISSATAPPAEVLRPAAEMLGVGEPMNFATEPTLDTGFPPPPPPQAEAAVARTPIIPADIDLEPLPPPVPPRIEAPEGIVGDQVSSAIASHIGSLVRNITTERAASVTRGGLTIEDLVREELRPILKAWLDSHLPSLVERIVRAEIERVIDRSQL